MEASNLGKAFGSKTVLEGANLRVEKGSKICIIGPSGSGKTTLLRCLNLLVTPTRGRLYYRGQLAGQWPDKGFLRNIQEHRRRIGMVFQHFELFPHLTALDNITLGPRNVLHLSKALADAKAMRLLEQIGLAEFASAHPNTLSGGQKQRIAIVRALAMEPDIVLFDEPTSALDAEMVGEVLQLMADLAHKGLTMIIVTHELQFAHDVADWVVVMEAGAVVEQGPSAVMFEAPTKTRTREILRLDRHSGSVR